MFMILMKELIPTQKILMLILFFINNLGTMRKIKVWRDDPAAPVKTLPDVVSNMI